MPREFDSYEDAKEYYDSMVDDRKRYGAFNAEYNRIENILKAAEVRPGEKLRDGLKEEMEVYKTVMDNLEKTFPEKYEVKDIHELVAKIRAFEPELERLRVQSQSYEIEHKTGSGDSNAQPPAGGENMSTHHDRTPSPRRPGSTDFGELYTKELDKVLQKGRDKDSQSRDGPEK